MVSIDTLKMIKTISALKVFIFLCEHADKKGFINTSMRTISLTAIISRNSVKSAINELSENGLIKVLIEGKGRGSSLFEIIKFEPKEPLKNESISDTQIKDSSPSTEKINDIKDSPKSWKKVTASKKNKDICKEPEPKNESNNEHNKDNKDINIINKELNNKKINLIIKDFNSYNFLHKDINSLSILNENLSLTDKQLGILAYKILTNWFIPLAKFTVKQPERFYPQQINLIKDLLVEYRTEQVLAGIKYWTTIEKPKNGFKSIMWLKFKRKGRSHVEVALDYYKEQYIITPDTKQAEEYIKAQEKKKQEEAIKREEGKKRVDEMSDDDFVKEYMAKLGKLRTGKYIKPKDESEAV